MSSPRQRLGFPAGARANWRKPWLAIDIMDR